MDVGGTQAVSSERASEQCWSDGVAGAAQHVAEWMQGRHRQSGGSIQVLGGLAVGWASGACCVVVVVVVGRVTVWLGRGGAGARRCAAGHVTRPLHAHCRCPLVHHASKPPSTRTAATVAATRASCHCPRPRECAFASSRRRCSRAASHRLAQFSPPNRRHRRPMSPPTARPSLLHLGPRSLALSR